MQKAHLFSYFVTTMASFRGALFSFNGGSAIIGRNGGFITGNGNNNPALWMVNKGPSAYFSGYAKTCATKTNLPIKNCIINSKPLSTLACKRFPILTFKTSAKGRIDCSKITHHFSRAQQPCRYLGNQSQSFQLPVCIHRTRASEISVSGEFIFFFEKMCLKIVFKKICILSVFPLMRQFVNFLEHDKPIIQVYLMIFTGRGFYSSIFRVAIK